ncbi:GNAT family N-acetyltransferase [Chryseobacterium phosphatilyticum]|uniref:GNAT family N-acetyltransferase n=1 Tax=Chryseobacterium phosphatilyticum TaxID=475075 RepID=A0A316X8W5_9FLAO|nr:GNAT family N-acetyltransferase [Chryseobacterium phosphatilyticum]PWN69206.1 GNAT family N-acetyltransferase [Chryseobacterium phosphatilyticum]
MKYHIKKTNELTEQEIEHILQLWDISAWNRMKIPEFHSLFKDSEFHFLIDAKEVILAVFRVNFDFTLNISGEEISFAEAVGLVAAQKKKGYGARLVEYFTENMKERNIETIGFCHTHLRPFYEKCKIEILYDKARAIKENVDSEWVNSDDDDILIFHISDERKKLLNGLSAQNNAYLIIKEQRNEL